jgi:hypothetical protein
MSTAERCSLVKPKAAKSAAASAAPPLASKLSVASKLIVMRSLAPLLLLLTLSAAAQQPSAPATSPPAVAGDETSDKAKKLLDRMIQALGGSAYLEIKNITQTGRTYTLFHGQSTGPGVLFWRFVEFPDKERVEVTKQRDIAYVYNGDKGYEITYKGTAQLESKVLNEYLRRRDHSLEWVLRKWLKEPGVAILYEGPAIAGDKPADQVSIINSENDSVTIYIDSQTHLPIKKTYSWRDPIDRLRNVEDEIYDAYRPTEGFMTPYSLTRFYNGEMVNQRFLNTVSYNDQLNSTMFDAKTTYDPATLPNKK